MMESGFHFLAGGCCSSVSIGWVLEELGADAPCSAAVGVAVFVAVVVAAERREPGEDIDGICIDAPGGPKNANCSTPIQHWHATEDCVCAGFCSSFSKKTIGPGFFSLRTYNCAIALTKPSSESLRSSSLSTNSAILPCQSIPNHFVTGERILAGDGSFNNSLREHFR